MILRLPANRQSCLLRLYRGLPPGKQGPADLTGTAITSPCRAMLPAIKDNPQVQLVPVFLGKELFEGTLRIRNILPAGELPALGEPVNVGVHRKRRQPEGL